MENLKEEFVPPHIAIAMMELGYNKPCFGFYWWDSHELCYDRGIFKSEELERIGAPTYQAALKWFRDEYNLRGFIGFRPNVKKFDYHIYDMGLSGREYVKQRPLMAYNKDPKVGTHKEAELGCLEKMIEFVKDS